MVQIFWISTGKLKCIPVYNYGDLRNLALPIPIRPYRLSPQHKDCLRLVGSDNEICTQCYSHINNRCVFTEPCSTSRTLVALDILYSGEFSWVLIFVFQCQETTPTNSEYRCVGVYPRNCSAPEKRKMLHLTKISRYAVYIHDNNNVLYKLIFYWQLLSL